MVCAANSIAAAALRSILHCMNDSDEKVESEKVRAQELAHALVEEAWNLGSGSMLLDVEYEGAIWEVSVKVKYSEG